MAPPGQHSQCYRRKDNTTNRSTPLLPVFFALSIRPEFRPAALVSLRQTMSDYCSSPPRNSSSQGCVHIGGAPSDAEAPMPSCFFGLCRCAGLIGDQDMLFSPTVSQADFHSSQTQPQCLSLRFPPYPISATHFRFSPTPFPNIIQHLFFRLTALCNPTFPLTDAAHKASQIFFTNREDEPERVARVPSTVARLRIKLSKMAGT